MSFQGKHVLITGGAGFIGSNLAIKMVECGANVTILDAMLDSYGGNLFNLKSINHIVNINLADMRDEKKLLSLIKGKDYIFNLAGQVSHQDSMTNPFLDLEINVKAQLTLLELCRCYAPKATIIYTSTRQIYGAPEYLPVDEQHVLNPPDINGINKLAAEQYHRLYTQVYGLNTVSLRLTNTYGPRQLIKNSRQGFIGWFINRAILGKTIQIFGTGQQIRDFTFVDDVVDALCLAATNSKCYGRIYNIGGEKATLKEVAQQIIENSGTGNLELVPFPEDRKRIDIGDFYGDYKNFQSDTGWQPKVALKEGLKIMIDYYKMYKEHYLG